MAFWTNWRISFLSFHENEARWNLIMSAPRMYSEIIMRRRKFMSFPEASIVAMFFFFLWGFGRRNSMLSVRSMMPILSPGAILFLFIHERGRETIYVAPAAVD